MKLASPGSRAAPNSSFAQAAEPARARIDKDAITVRLEAWLADSGEDFDRRFSVATRLCKALESNLDRVVMLEPGDMPEPLRQDLQTLGLTVIPWEDEINQAKHDNAKSPGEGPADWQIDDVEGRIAHLVSLARRQVSDMPDAGQRMDRGELEFQFMDMIERIAKLRFPYTKLDYLRGLVEKTAWMIDPGINSEIRSVMKFIVQHRVAPALRELDFGEAVTAGNDARDQVVAEIEQRVCAMNLSYDIEALVAELPKGDAPPASDLQRRFEALVGKITSSNSNMPVAARLALCRYLMLQTAAHCTSQDTCAATKDLLLELQLELQAALGTLALGEQQPGDAAFIANLIGALRTRIEKMSAEQMRVEG